MPSDQQLRPAYPLHGNPEQTPDIDCDFCSDSIENQLIKLNVATSISNAIIVEFPVFWGLSSR